LAPPIHALNRRKHGVSIERVREIDGSGVLPQPDTKKDYRALRDVGYALVGERLECIVFAQRANTMKIISPHKAEPLEA
jgi:uncharacterized protein